ncbi:hypothetical protein ACIRG5_09700 [Lentzea sp. NPDC102401]|uniref:hypothetical protein n=1 Tax=Lentzea sp. NPDC102401 TaxID=3364128 RepID=UPI0037FD0126
MRSAHGNRKSRGRRRDGDGAGRADHLRGLGSGIRKVEYSPGDRAFRAPGFHSEPDGPVADLELTAVVHAPRTLVGKRPLVLLAHGCWKWPCPAGDAFPSYHGYDHLAEELARQGFVVVPVSVNGVDVVTHQPIG